MHNLDTVCDFGDYDLPCHLHLNHSDVNLAYI